MAHLITRGSGSLTYFANSNSNYYTVYMGQGIMYVYAFIPSTKIFSVSFTNRKVDPVPEMTTPEKLYSSIMQTLKYLNSHLPNGSHVILYGLPDGRFLWDNLHDRYYPLGISLKILLLFNNVSYT